MIRFRGVGVFLSFCALAGALWAKSSGSSTAHSLKLGVGGRGVAMGEAQVAAADDAMALYWNPAGLAPLSQNEISFMHSQVSDGVTQDVLYYVRPTQSLGVFGLGGSLFRVKGIKGFDAQNIETSDLQASDSLLTLGWARSWEEMKYFPGLQAGANLKAIQKKLDTESALGFMADLGLLYTAQGGWVPGFKTALVLQNVGTGLSFGGETTSFPTVLKLGGAYPIFGDNMTVTGDLVLPMEGNPFVNLGGEYRVWEILAFRVGFKGGNDLDSGMTYGFGVGNERLQLDYGFVPFGPFGDSHRVSLRLRFGETYRQTAVVSQVDVAYKRALARYAQGYLVESYMQANQILMVAPWHRPAKLLAKRIETEFKHMESGARQEQLQSQVDDHFARGEQFFQVDDLLRARREFQAILALQADHMGAKTYLNRIDERFQSLTEKFYDMAVQAFASQDYAQAGELAEKVLKLNPDHLEAKELKSNVEKVLKEAETVAEQQLLAETKAPLVESARQLYDQKKYEEALAKFNAILDLDTTDTEAMRLRDLCKESIAKGAYNAGLRLAREGDFEAASVQMKRALKFRPGYTEARDYLKEIESKIGSINSVKSKELYKDSLDAFLAGDPQKAYELAVKALELNPENVEAQRMRDRLAQKTGVNP